MPCSGIADGIVGAPRTLPHEVHGALPTARPSQSDVVATLMQRVAAIASAQPAAPWPTGAEVQKASLETATSFPQWLSAGTAAPLPPRQRPPEAAAKPAPAQPPAPQAPALPARSASASIGSNSVASRDGLPNGSPYPSVVDAMAAAQRQLAISMQRSEPAAPAAPPPAAPLSPPVSAVKASPDSAGGNTGLRELQALAQGSDWGVPSRYARAPAAAPAAAAAAAQAAPHQWQWPPAVPHAPDSPSGHAPARWWQQPLSPGDAIESPAPHATVDSPPLSPPLPPRRLESTFFPGRSQGGAEAAGPARDSASWQGGHWQAATGLDGVKPVSVPFEACNVLGCLKKCCAMVDGASPFQCTASSISSACCILLMP